MYTMFRVVSRGGLMERGRRCEDLSDSYSNVQTEYPTRVPDTMRRGASWVIARAT